MKKIILCVVGLMSVSLLAACGNGAPSLGEGVEASYEVVELGHDGWSTVPEVTTLSAGKSYKFVITPETNGIGCMSTIKWKGDVQGHVVSEGRAIEMVLDNAEPGEYEMVCNGMGMRQGSIIIE